jgi:muconolactone delta-isomerase
MCGHISYSHTNAHIDRTPEAAEDVLKELANVPARVRSRRPNGGHMKFLVLWHFGNTRLTPEIISAVLEQPQYGKKLEAQGKLECRYHVVGSHGGAWIYNVDSNEELDRLLAMSPVYNFAVYQVLPLAEMTDPPTVAGKRE